MQFQNFTNNKLSTILYARISLFFSILNHSTGKMAHLINSILDFIQNGTVYKTMYQWLVLVYHMLHAVIHLSDVRRKK